MTKLHLVKGTTGEYADRRSWTVAAFTSKRRAATWARKANEWAVSHAIHVTQRPSFADRENVPGSPWDPDRPRVQYTGLQYYVVTGVVLDPPLPAGKLT